MKFERRIHAVLHRMRAAESPAALARARERFARILTVENARKHGDPDPFRDPHVAPARQGLTSSG